MQTNRRHFTGGHLNEDCSMARAVPRNYYEQNINSLNRVVSAERNPRGITQMECR